MKKLLAFLNLACFVGSLVCFLFLAVITIGDKSFTGIQYLFGYKEKVNLIIHDTELVYFKGFPVIGIVMCASVIVGAVFAVFALLAKKKMVKFAMLGCLLASLAPMAYTFFITSSEAVFSGYGDAAISSLVLGNTASVGVGAILFFVLNAFAFLASLFSVSQSK